MRFARRIAGVWVLLFGAVGFAVAQTPPPITNTGAISLQLKIIADNVIVGSPLDGTFSHDGDNRLFLANRAGTIDVITKNPMGTYMLDGAHFVDLTAVSGVSLPLIAGGEQGFLGLAFHPDFNAPSAPGYRKFYTYTSEQSSGGVPHIVHNTEPTIVSHHSVIREWTTNSAGTGVEGTTQVPDQGRVLMRIVQPQGNHNGGALKFGPDNYLYISLGDGGGGDDSSGGLNENDGHTNAGSLGGPAAHGNAQDVRNVLGKILRIKPTTDADPNTTSMINGVLNDRYRVPIDNPFAGDTAGLDEIFAYGLRNPFRMSFDRDTGKLYAGDVGQGAQEEVDEIVNGANYGWVIKEGINTRYTYSTADTLIDPLAAYTHSDGISVIGGFVYRGQRIPELQGLYVFGDYFGLGSSGRLFYLDPNEVLSPGQLHTIHEFNLTGDPKPNNRGLYGFGEDADGELYALFVNESDGSGLGTVIALVPKPLLGDFNRDFKLTNADMQAMLDALRDLTAYQTAKQLSPGELLQLGDLNGDNNVSLADLQPLLNLLVAGGAAAVPEPASALLLALGGFWLLIRRRRRAPLS